VVDMNPFVNFTNGMYEEQSCKRKVVGFESPSLGFMNEKELFEWLKNNLFLKIESREYCDGSGCYVNIDLMLKNPDTGKAEKISSESYHP
jgi:hypothetical protein